FNDRFPLGGVIENGGSAVCINVADLVGPQFRPPQRLLHPATRTASVWIWLRQMMIIGGNSVANYFAKDFCAAAAGGFEFLQREQGRAFPQHHARSIAIEGSTFFRRCRLQ